MFGTLEKELERKTIRFKEDLTYLSKLESNKENRVKAFESINLVESLGFINSKVVKQSRELISKNESFTCAIRIASESLLFMKNLIDYFGEGIVLVKKEDFIHLIQKYDLVCGDFSDYLGVIPDENLQRISECKEKLMSIPTNCSDGLSNLYWNATNLYKLTSVSTYYRSGLKSSTARIVNKFPFMVSDTRNYYNNNSTALRLFLGTYLNIPESETNKISNCSCTRVLNGMFIAAPRKEMKNAEKGISFRIQPDDPFICSLSKYGIVIYSRWGKEASDKTFKKYEDLFAKLK
jgi:hypothetical protein